MSVKSVGGSGPASGPPDGGNGITPQELKGKTDDQLTKMLIDPKLSDREKMMVLAEMVSRQQQAAEAAAAGDSLAADDNDKLKKILDKLLRGEALTAEEKQLLLRLGIDVNLLKLGTNNEQTANADI